MKTRTLSEPRTQRQRARQDAHYPDTMSRAARALVSDAADLAFWQSRATLIGAPEAIAVLRESCARQAAALIAAGMQP
jgi:hypothetical protein